MNALFVILIIAAAGMVVFALARGLVAFARAHEGEQRGEDMSVMHNRQTEMMFARVKWQAVVIVLLVLFGMLAAGSR